MGIDFAIDSRTRLVRLRYNSEATVEEVMGTLRAVFRSADYRPGFGVLADRRRVTAPSREFVQQLLAIMVLHREALTGSRWAIVASTGLGERGRVEEGLVESAPLPVRVFHALDDAERWLQDRDPGR